MLLNTCKMWSNGIKITFFQKNPKKLPSIWGFGPKPPSVIRLSKLVFLHTSPNLHIFIFNFWIKRSPFRKLFVKCQSRPQLLIIKPTIFLSQKKFLLQKFLMTSLHDNFGLALPHSKILATPMHGGGCFLGRAPSPNHSLCLPRGPANFCPKTGHHKRFFFVETEDRSSERNQIA